MIFLVTLAIVAWLYLILFRGFFWMSAQQHTAPGREMARWPSVIAVVPARNEAHLIGRTLTSLRRQDYAGEFSIILIDDSSEDETAGLARRAADGDGHSLHVLAGEALPKGWTGKLWAMSQGVRETERILPHAEYLWFTDADLEHDSQTLRDLVWLAENQGLNLVSNLAMLHCASFWERLLVPAFVFFFCKLYPFNWVNRPGTPVAAAAGGSMLVRREALRQAGGLGAIRAELIDDCALARLIKAHGPIRIELTRNSISIRPYEFADIWRMVARSAYTQLHCSPLRLLLTVAGMTLIYLVPWIGIVFGITSGRFLIAELGATAWALMTLAYWPSIRLYRQNGLMSLLLPVAAILYTLMTINSALLHGQGKGGQWKGRIQA